MEQNKNPSKEGTFKNKKLFFVLVFIVLFFVIAWGMQKLLPQDFSASLIHANAIESSSNISLSSNTEPVFTEPVFSGGGLRSGLDILGHYIPGLGVIESGSVIGTVFFLIKVLLVIAGLLAFIAFIWAGFLYITTFIKEDNNETAKKVMIYAAIGIIVILLSYTIVHFLATLTV
jgi:hypothetical protein